MLEGRLLSSRETLHAPHLIDLEVSQVLRRYLFSKDLSTDRAADAIEDFQNMRIFLEEGLPQRDPDKIFVLFEKRIAIGSVFEAINA